MDINTYLETRERRSNKITTWQDRLTRAQMARGAWDKAFQICKRIRSNEIPLKKEGSELAEFTDEYYRDNWILKSNIWKSSLIQTADVVVEVRAKASFADQDENRELMEMDVNYMMDEFDMVRRGVDVADDQIWYGYGVSYLGWNSARMDKFWKTGRPDFRVVDCRAFWVDESSSARAWTDRRWEFAKFQMDIEDAKDEFPEYADQISELMSNPDYGDAPDRKENFDVYLCQYRKPIKVQMVDVNYRINGNIHTEQVYWKDVEDFLANFKDGEELPDNVRLSDKYTTEIECWFQFYFNPWINGYLSEIEYIGNLDHFQIMWGLKHPTDIYPRSWAFYLSDLVDISTVAMTLVAVQAIKNGNPTPFVEGGAIMNMDDFRDNHNALDYVAQIDPVWREQHPDARPVWYAEGRYDANVAALLYNFITDAIKTSTGSIDTVRGETKSGVSGVANAQYQSAAAIYTKQDELAYSDYLKQLTEINLQYTGKYRTYEHKLVGVGMGGKEEIKTLNPGDVATWDWEQYYTVPMIENNPEMVKQLKRNEAMQLRGAGEISRIDLFEMLGYPNAERLNERKLQEDGILQVVQILMANPEIMQGILSGAMVPQAQQNKPA